MPSHFCNVIKNKFLPNKVPKPEKTVITKETTIESPSTSVSKSNTIDPSDPIQWISLPTDHEARVHGFEAEIMSLKKLIGVGETRENFKAIGVIGEYGVGKSTLCQELYRQISKDNTTNPTFTPRIWVSMPTKEASLKTELPKRVLKKLGFEAEKITEICRDHPGAALLYALRLSLLGKKYLIVLDDVRVDDLWCKKLSESVSFSEDRLASALPKESGGTVIVVSRNEEAAKAMVAEDGTLHRVLALDSDETSVWEIFKDAIPKFDSKLDVEVLEELVKKLKVLNYEELRFEKKIDVEEILKKRVVRKCNGLPLAAILMARTVPENLKLITEKKEKEKEEKEKRLKEMKAKQEADKKGKTESKTGGSRKGDTSRQDESGMNEENKGVEESKAQQGETEEGSQKRGDEDSEDEESKDEVEDAETEKKEKKRVEGVGLEKKQEQVQEEAKAAS